MKYTFLIVMSAALTFLSPPPSTACSCADPDLSRSISNATAIFSARVVTIARESITFEVEQVWKGDVAQRVTLDRGGNSCDVSFREGVAYLVYARTRKDFLTGAERWYTNECARTRRLSEAVADLARLRGFNPSHTRKGP